MNQSHENVMVELNGQSYMVATGPGTEGLPWVDFGESYFAPGGVPTPCEIQVGGEVVKAGVARLHIGGETRKATFTDGIDSYLEVEGLKALYAEHHPEEGFVICLCVPA